MSGVCSSAWNAARLHHVAGAPPGSILMVFLVLGVGVLRPRVIRRLAPAHRLHLVPLRLEEVPHERGGVLVVLDHQDAGGLRRHRTTAWLSTVTVTSRASSSGVKGFGR